MSGDDKSSEETESREDESEEEESEEEGDNEYDYGFVGDDDDDEDYEVDISGMNVSPEILAMLGASEEVINAKKTEIEEVASTWIPPKESGLEHSDVIANHNEIALLQEGGADKRNLKVVRVMNKVGEYSNSGNNRNYGSPEESTGATTTLLEPLQITTINVKGKHGFESVPEIKKSQLSQEDIDDSTGSDCSEASASWDELSMVEGMPWCMVNSDDEIEEGTLEFVSPNLHKILGFNPPGKKEVDTGNGSPSGSTWTPPTFSGLMNSKPIVTLQQLTVNGGSGMQVQMKDRNLPRQDSEGRNEHEDDESSWDSDEDGEWDYKDIDDDEYTRSWKTNISPNLIQDLGNEGYASKRHLSTTVNFDWKPPPKPGLSNSKPLVVFEETAGQVASKLC